MSNILNYLKPTVTKKQFISYDKMIYSNINNVYVKCYLKFYKIVADIMHGYASLAMLLTYY